MYVFKVLCNPVLNSGGGSKIFSGPPPLYFFKCNSPYEFNLGQDLVELNYFDSATIGFTNAYFVHSYQSNRVYSTSESEGLKLAIFDHFCNVLVTYKGIPPIYGSIFSPDLA